MSADPRTDRLTAAIAEVFADEGLVSDWIISVEIIDPDGNRHLRTGWSETAADWKGLGMAHYIIAGLQPQPKRSKEPE